MIISRASAADLPTVWDVLDQVARRLQAAGRPSWPNRFTAERIGSAVDRGNVYLAWDHDGTPAGTITVSGEGDPAFWRPRELAEPASYVSTMARADRWPGVGTMMLHWAVNAADERGDRWVRLDAGRDNGSLHRYYLGQGFAQMRTEDAPGRNSGALFQRLALPQPHEFMSAPPLPLRTALARPLGRIPVGAEVVTQAWEHGVVTKVLGPDADHPVVPADWEYATGQTEAIYWVRFRDGREIIAAQSDLTETATVMSTANV